MLALSAFGKYVLEMTKIFILKFKIVLMGVFTEKFYFIYLFL